LLYLAIGVVQLAAYFQGMELWLGIGWILSFVIFLIGTWLPFGSFVLAGIAFYGAHKGWRWEWWQAALLTFPFAIMSLIIMSAGGIAGVREYLRNRRPA
jgi:hypothetical protein